MHQAVLNMNHHMKLKTQTTYLLLTQNYLNQQDILIYQAKHLQVV